MYLNKTLKKAQKFISRLRHNDLKKLKNICAEIREAEKNLITKAFELSILDKCEKRCKGICCKNIQIDAVINFLDFVYILGMDNSFKDDIRKCLKNETLFISDCVFLKNNEGPCIFPYGLKPEKCVITFCFDEDLIKKEINLVRTKFTKLHLFIIITNLKYIKKKLL